MMTKHFSPVALIIVDRYDLWQSLIIIRNIRVGAAGPYFEEAMAVCALPCS